MPVQTLYTHTCTYTIIARYTGPLQPDITKQIYPFFKGQW